MSLQFSRACRPDAARNNGDSGVWAGGKPTGALWIPMLIFRKLGIAGSPADRGRPGQRSDPAGEEPSHRPQPAIDRRPGPGQRAGLEDVGDGAGGKRLWDRFASAEDKALRQQFRRSSKARCPVTTRVSWRLPEGIAGGRDNQHLTTTGAMSPAALADDISDLGRFDDPDALLAAECEAVTEIASELRRLGYANLGRLLSVTPTRGQPLLAVAVQYYFRRAVGADEVLARELTWTRLSTLDRRLEDGFAFLALIQERQAQALEETLNGLARVEGVAGETRDAVFDVHADVLRLTDQFRLCAGS